MKLHLYMGVIWKKLGELFLRSLTFHNGACVSEKVGQISVHGISPGTFWWKCNKCKTQEILYGSHFSFIFICAVELNMPLISGDSLLFH